MESNELFHVVEYRIVLGHSFLTRMNLPALLVSLEVRYRQSGNIHKTSSCCEYLHLLAFRTYWQFIGFQIQVKSITFDFVVLQSVARIFKLKKGLNLCFIKVLGYTDHRGVAPSVLSEIQMLIGARTTLFFFCNCWLTAGLDL